MTAPNNPTPEVEREALVGKLWAMHGIAQSSEDGFTYLNDAARVVIAEGATTITRLTAERDTVRKANDKLARQIVDDLEANKLLSERVAVLELQIEELKT